MTLPSRVKAFWYELLSLGPHVERTSWGAVATDERYPRVWEANMAAVLEPDEALEREAIRAALRPALIRAGAHDEHVEFWETSVDSPALTSYRDDEERPNHDVAMVLGAAAEAPAPGSVAIEEVTRPDPSFWPWYRDSLREFGMALPEDVLDQLVLRTRQVLMPAGLRWFVASIDGERAGYATLLSLAGVGYVEDVVTMPAFRRRGVASCAVASAIQASRRAGDAQVFLLTEDGGDPRRLYQRLGFRVAASIESFTTSLVPERA